MQNFEKFLDGKLAYSFLSKEDMLFFIDKIFSLKNKPNQQKSLWVDAANGYSNRIAFTTDHKSDGSCRFYATESGIQYLEEGYNINLCYNFSIIDESTQLFAISDKIKSCKFIDNNIVFTGEQFEKIIPFSSFIFVNGVFTHNISYFNFTI